MTETNLTIDTIQTTIGVLLIAMFSRGWILSEIYMKLQEVEIDIAYTGVTDSIKRIVSYREGMDDFIRPSRPRCALRCSCAPGKNTKVYMPIISDILEAIGVTIISSFGYSREFPQLASRRFIGSLVEGAFSYN